ncbi:MAG: PD40 domain-containing protein [Ahniella sp.]|nr:PD40 domain-containing protein [Ahniella sp.]
MPTSDNPHSLQAQVFAALSAAALDQDPERSILLGMQALDATLRHGEPAELAAQLALRQAIWQSRLRRVLRYDANAAPTCADWSPNGSLIVTGSADGPVVLWAAKTGERLWSNPLTNTWSIAFSPDGTKIAVGSLLPNVAILDASNGTVLMTIRIDQAFSVCFSPDGRRLAIQSSTSSGVWDVETAALLMTLGGGSVSNVAWSPDGKRIATCASGVRLWDANTGAAVQNLGPDRNVTSVAWSPDSTMLAVALDAVWQATGKTKWWEGWDLRRGPWRSVDDASRASPSRRQSISGVEPRRHPVGDGHGANGSDEFFPERCRARCRQAWLSQHEDLGHACGRWVGWCRVGDASVRGRGVLRRIQPGRCADCGGLLRRHPDHGCGSRHGMVSFSDARPDPADRCCLESGWCVACRERIERLGIQERHPNLVCRQWRSTSDIAGRRCGACGVTAEPELERRWLRPGGDLCATSRGRVGYANPAARVESGCRDGLVAACAQPRWNRSGGRNRKCRGDDSRGGIRACVADLGRSQCRSPDQHGLAAGWQTSGDDDQFHDHRLVCAGRSRAVFLRESPGICRVCVQP